MVIVDLFIEVLRLIASSELLTYLFIILIISFCVYIAGSLFRS